MKERIVLEEHEFYNLLHFLPKQMVKIVKKERKAIFIGKEIKPEKVPETWEDLKELCLELNNKTKDIDVHCVYSEHIEIQWYNDDNTDIDIYKDGTIFVENHLVADDRTIEQMWQIIKGLIGEE